MQTQRPQLIVILYSIPLLRNIVNIFLEFSAVKKSRPADGSSLFSSCTVFSVGAALQVAHTLLARLLEA